MGAEAKTHVYSTYNTYSKFYSLLKEGAHRGRLLMASTYLNPALIVVVACRVVYIY